MPHLGKTIHVLFGRMLSSTAMITMLLHSCGQDAASFRMYFLPKFHGYALSISVVFVCSCESALEQCSQACAGAWADLFVQGLRLLFSKHAIVLFKQQSFMGCSSKLAL